MKLTKQQIIIAALTLGFVSFGTGYIVGTPHNGAKTQVEGQFNNGPGRADQKGAKNPGGRGFGKGGHHGFKGPDCDPGTGNQGQANGQQPGNQQSDGQANGQQPSNQTPDNQQPSGQTPDNQQADPNGNQDQNSNQSQNNDQQAAPQTPGGQSSDQKKDQSTDAKSSQSTQKESGSGTTQKKSTE